MKIKYLGTGAAEGIPAVYCHCDICRHARLYGGRNIRTRTQALVDGLFLIDFGPDTYMHALNYKIELADIEACLVTHSHDDHLYPADLKSRRRSRACLRPETPPLVVYGGQGVREALCVLEDDKVTKDGSVVFQLCHPFQSFNVCGCYEITPLPAIHGTEEPFAYMIRHEGSCFLYGHDTDLFEDATWEWLRSSRAVFNAVSLDCTEGVKHMDYKGHMNFERIDTFCAKMKIFGLLAPEAAVVANHISHNGRVTHDTAVAYAKERGIIVAYDGMELDV